MGSSISLAASISKIAERSKEWGHFVEEMGSRMGSNVRGQRVERRSAAIWMSSSSSLACSSAAAEPRLLFPLPLRFFALVVLLWLGVVESPLNQVEACGKGGASSPGCWAS